MIPNFRVDPAVFSTGLFVERKNTMARKSAACHRIWRIEGLRIKHVF
jgi:hypothetical protein